MSKEITFAMDVIDFAIFANKNEHDLTKEEERLVSMARELDRLANEARDAANDIADRSARYAQRVERDGFVHHEPTPMVYSTCNDLVRAAAQASALWPIFGRAFHDVTGKRFEEAVREMTEASFFNGDIAVMKTPGPLQGKRASEAK